MADKYWGTFKQGRKYQDIGPFASRQEAAQGAFGAAPKLRTISTGRGEYGPQFDIRWHNREDSRG